MNKNKLLKVLLVAPLLVGAISIASCGASQSEDAKSPFVKPIFETYRVTFLDHEGDVLYQTDVKEHENAIYEGDKPAKPSDEYYNYYFNGWDKPLLDITAPTEFSPTFGEILRQYVVNYYDEEGNLLDSQIVNAGEEAVYDGPTPTKPSDENWDYVFTGKWTSDTSEVTSDLNLKPVFEQQVRKYHVTFTVDGTSIHTKRVEKGQAIGPYDGPTPYKASVESDDGKWKTVYTFSGWDTNLNTTIVNGNMEVAALFTTHQESSDRGDFGDIIENGDGNVTGEPGGEEEEGGITYKTIFIGEDDINFSGYYLGADDTSNNYLLKYEGYRDLTNNDGSETVKGVKVSYLVPFEYKNIAEATGTCVYEFPDGRGNIEFTFNMQALGLNTISPININRKYTGEVGQFVNKGEEKLKDIVTEHNVQLRKWIDRVGDKLPSDFNPYL